MNKSKSQKLNNKPFRFLNIKIIIPLISIKRYYLKYFISLKHTGIKFYFPTNFLLLYKIRTI